MRGGVLAVSGAFGSGGEQVGAMVATRMEETLQLRLPVAVVIGGGGKTSLIYRLAAERSRAGRPTLVTTTAHMWPPTDEQRRACRMGPAVYAQGLTAATFGVERALAGYPTAFLGAGLDPRTGKVAGVDPDLPAYLAEAVPALDEPGAVLVEADGSAGHPLKRYRSGEPAWPVPPFECIAVVGIDAWGRPLGPDICHRFGAESASCFGEAELMEYCRGFVEMARAVHARLTLVFNRFDAASDRRGILTAARRAARLAGVAQVLVGSTLEERS